MEKTAQRCNVISSGSQTGEIKNSTETFVFIIRSFCYLIFNHVFVTLIKKISVKSTHVDAE